MTKEGFFAHCLAVYGTEPDHPFGRESDERIGVVNLELPTGMHGLFAYF